VALCSPANRGIAWHVRHRIGRQCAKTNMRTEARGRVCRFATGVARTNHDHVE
jgi:hypothetical protein